MAGIYLHIPFCKTRCIYCDFYSTTRSELKARYIQALCQELEIRKAELSRGGFSTETMGMSWWIRGLSTVNGTTPMVILDGVLCPNTNYVYLSPDEIESVTVLKDAAVLSLYGIQGANGYQYPEKDTSDKEEQKERDSP